jgi:hypothetical protein
VLVWGQVKRVYTHIWTPIPLCQVVTSVPSKRMPKNLRYGTEMPKASDFGDFGEQMSPDGTAHERRSGQILWVRGLTRLQTQVSWRGTWGDAVDELRALSRACVRAHIVWLRARRICARLYLRVVSTAPPCTPSYPPIPILKISVMPTTTYLSLYAILLPISTHMIIVSSIGDVSTPTAHACYGNFRQLNRHLWVKWVGLLSPS